MLLTLLPTAAFAEEAHEHVYEEAFACICTVECTEWLLLLTFCTL